MVTEIPHGLEQIIATFGNPADPDFELENIVSFELPYVLVYDGLRVGRTRCHRLVVENFRYAFDRISAAGLEAECFRFGGIYNQRKKRGGTRASTHSWGIAIDMEPQKYPLGSKDRFPYRIVEIFRQAGFFYGGDFARPDPMHFQCCTGY